MMSPDTGYAWQPSPHFELGDAIRQLVGDGLGAASEQARGYFDLPDRDKRFFLQDWAKRKNKDPRLGPVRLGPEYAALAAELELAVLQAERRLFCLMASEEDDHAALARLHGALQTAARCSEEVLGEGQLTETVQAPCEAACRYLEDFLAQHELTIKQAGNKKHRYPAPSELRDAVTGLYEISLDALRDHIDSTYGPEARDYEKPRGASLEVRHAAASRTLPPEARDSWFVVEWVEELQNILRQAERDISGEKGLLAYPVRLGRAANRLAGWPEHLQEDLVGGQILSEAEAAGQHFVQLFHDLERAVFMLEDYVGTCAEPLLPHFHLNVRPSSRHYLRVRPPERPKSAVFVPLPSRRLPVANSG